MKTLVHAKTKSPVDIGEVVRDNRGRRYYISHIHNNKVTVVSMDERRIHKTAAPQTFNCYFVAN